MSVETLLERSVEYVMKNVHDTVREGMLDFLYDFRKKLESIDHDLAKEFEVDMREAIDESINGRTDCFNENLEGAVESTVYHAYQDAVDVIFKVIEEADVNITSQDDFIDEVNEDPENYIAGMYTNFRSQ